MLRHPPTALLSAAAAVCAPPPRSQGRCLTVRVSAYGMKAEYVWSDGGEGTAAKVLAHTAHTHRLCARPPGTHTTHPGREREHAAPHRATAACRTPHAQLVRTLLFPCGLRCGVGPAPTVPPALRRCVFACAHDDWGRWDRKSTVGSTCHHGRRPSASNGSAQTRAWRAGPTLVFCGTRTHEPDDDAATCQLIRVRVHGRRAT